MAAVPVLRKSGVPTIFGELEEKNVTFLIDTSGSMYTYLQLVKEHLLEFLLSRAFHRGDCHFNIVEFSDQVSPWADRQVRLTPQTVTVANEWINKLASKTGSNMLDALLVAFTDPACEAVCLVSDGLPDQQATVILQQVALASQGRPLHVIHLTGTHADVASYDFLESLAIQTAGTFNVISVSTTGRIEQVKAVVRKDHARERIVTDVYEYNPEPLKTKSVITTLDNPPVSSIKTYDPELSDIPNTSIKSSLSNPPVAVTSTYIENAQQEPVVKTCSVKTSLDHNPFAVPVIPIDEPGTIIISSDSVVKFPNIAWETYRPPRYVKDVVLVDDDKFSVTASTLMVGMKVICRHERDGFFYIGSIIKPITSARRFLVEFDEIPGGGKHQQRLQETAIYDLVAYHDAMRHSIAAGDKVLAPWELNGTRYAPGTVLEGVEKRSAGGLSDSDDLVVTFYDGKTSTVPKETALWIPIHLYERIKLELQMPATARADLHRYPEYPLVAPPGYPVTVIPQPPDYDTVVKLKGDPTRHVYIPIYPDQMPMYAMPVATSTVQPSAVRMEDVERVIPGTNLTKSELNQKVMQQLMDHKMLSHGDSRKVSFRVAAADKDSGFGSGHGETEEEERLEDEEEMRKIKQVKEKVKKDLYRDKQTETDLRRLKMIDTELYKTQGVETDSKLLFYQTPKKKQEELDERPPWKNWKQTPQPRTRAGSRGVTAFRDTALNPPLEAKARALQYDPDIPMYKSVDFDVLDRGDYMPQSQNGTPIRPQPPKVQRRQHFRQERKQNLNERPPWKSWQQSSHGGVSVKPGRAFREAPVGIQTESAWSEVYEPDATYQPNHIEQSQAWKNQGHRLEDSPPWDSQEQYSQDRPSWKSHGQRLQDSPPWKKQGYQLEDTPPWKNQVRLLQDRPPWKSRGHTPHGRVATSANEYREYAPATPSVAESEYYGPDDRSANFDSGNHNIATERGQVSWEKQQHLRNGEPVGPIMVAYKEHIEKSKRGETQATHVDDRPVWKSHGRGHVGGYSTPGVTRFRETSLNAPLEARSQPISSEPEMYGPVNQSAVFQAVDQSGAHGDRALLLHELKHGQLQRQRVTVGLDTPALQRVGRRDKAREAKENGYLESRRRQTMERDMTLQQRDRDMEQQLAARDQQHRFQHQQQLQKDAERRMNEEKTIANTMETKRALTSQVMTRIDDYAKREAEREAIKLEAKRQQVQRRAEIQEQRQQEIDNTIARRQEIKHQNSLKRSEEQKQRIQENHRQEMEREMQMRNKEINRREHFRNIEQDNQEKKDLRIAVKEMKTMELRSKILP
ncbi:uncharacterized protein LOC100372388 [Saccoglossus kowalevskii]|uniref:Uncharacterized protein LOC100372388 n=1 Tax=Saccoglossus kowalevskii TaxID=10224 RepID=A0ABM0GWF4_SACKO|nr:PREDICTED: uncharacterized protein LOC100372388 [Saccoglossus kowalevskii]